MLLKYLPPRGSRNIATRDVLHPSWPTSATPATFAPPVDFHEDDAAFTLFFDIGERTAPTLEVNFSGRAIIVLGETLGYPSFPRAIRVFLLESNIDTLGISTRFETPKLVVRIPKTPAGRRTIVVRRGEE